MQSHPQEIPDDEVQKQQNNQKMNNYQDVQKIVFTKGCLELGHNKNKPLFICINQYCKEQSAIVCSQCIQENKHQNHNDSLLEYHELIENYRSNQIQITNYPQNELVSLIYKNAPKNNNEIYNIEDINAQSSYISEIENFLDELVENFRAQIHIIKKEIKIKSQVQILELKKLGHNFKQKIEKAYTLDPIFDALKDFQQENINIQELNKQIKKFTHDKSIQTVQKDLLKDLIEFQQQNDNQTNNNKNDLREYKTYKILNPQGNREIQKEIQQLLDKIPIKIFKQLGKHFSVPQFKTFQSQNFVKKICEFQNIYQGQQGGYDNMYSEPFQTSQNIKIQFRFIKIQGSNFFVSLNNGKGENASPQYFWQDKSFGVSLIGQCSNTNFKQKGKSFFSRAVKDAIYIITVNLSENLFMISDEQEKNYIQCTANLNSLITDDTYYIALGSNMSCPGWELQIL